MFKFKFNIPSSSSAISASFYDLFNDGVLDILVSIKNDGSIKTRAYENQAAQDASFLSIQASWLQR